MQSEMRRAPSRVEDWLNVTRNSIRNSFMRIASQARAEDDREITEVTPGRGERAGVPRCPQEKARLQGAAAPLNKGLGPFSPVHWQVNVCCRSAAIRMTRTSTNWSVWCCRIGSLSATMQQKEHPLQPRGLNTVNVYLCRISCCHIRASIVPNPPKPRLRACDASHCLGLRKKARCSNTGMPICAA